MLKLQPVPEFGSKNVQKRFPVVRIVLRQSSAPQTGGGVYTSTHVKLGTRTQPPPIYHSALLGRIEEGEDFKLENGLIG